MESSHETMNAITVPQTVQGQIAEDLENLIARVRVQVQGRTGQREWALARTNLEQAAHWVSEARDMNGARRICPDYPDREVAVG